MTNEQVKELAKRLFTKKIERYANEAFKSVGGRKQIMSQCRDKYAEALRIICDTLPNNGEWIRVAGGSLIDDYRCSCCDKKPPVKQIPEKKTWGWDFTDFCPSCGADMRGEK